MLLSERLAQMKLRERITLPAVKHRHTEFVIQQLINSRDLPGSLRRLYRSYKDSWGVTENQSRIVAEIRSIGCLSLGKPLTIASELKATISGLRVSVSGGMCTIRFPRIVDADVGADRFALSPDNLVVTRIELSTIWLVLTLIYEARHGQTEA